MFTSSFALPRGAPKGDSVTTTFPDHPVLDSISQLAGEDWRLHLSYLRVEAEALGDTPSGRREGGVWPLPPGRALRSAEKLFMHDDARRVDPKRSSSLAFVVPRRGEVTGPFSGPFSIEPLSSVKGQARALMGDGVLFLAGAVDRLLLEIPRGAGKARRLLRRWARGVTDAA